MNRFFALLWQPIRPFEFTAPVFDQMKYWLLALKPMSTIIFASARLRSWLTRRFVNERVVELPWVLGNLPPPPVRILDVGACESPLALMLASIGYQVTAVDLRPYPFTHPNLEAVTGDITRWLPAQYYNIIICLSTLEHVGLPVYAGAVMSDGDVRAVKQMWQLLRPGGQLLLTVPLARRYRVRPAWREYDIGTLKSRLRLFKS